MSRDFGTPAARVVCACMYLCVLFAVSDATALLFCDVVNIGSLLTVHTCVRC